MTATPIDLTGLSKFASHIERPALTDVKYAQPGLKLNSALDFASNMHLPVFKANIETLWKAGRFSEVVEVIAKELHMLSALNIEKLSDRDTLQQLIGTTFVTQHQLIALSNKAELRPSPPCHVLALQQTNSQLQTRIFNRVVELVRELKQKAGKPVPAVGALTVYMNTKKTAGYKPPAEIRAHFINKLKKLIANGGDISDLKQLDRASLDALPNGAALEFCMDEAGVTRIGFDHTLLAWGQSVRAAGNIRVFKNEDGELTQILLGNFSGHYQPPIESLAAVVSYLTADDKQGGCGVAPEIIAVQSGEAGTPRTLEVLYDALGVNGDELQRDRAALEAEASRYNPVAPAAGKPKGKEIVTPDEVFRRTIELNEAQQQMNLSLQRALQNSMILTRSGECDEVLGTIKKVVEAAEAAGSPNAFYDALAVLQHLTTLKSPVVDDAAKSKIGALYAKYEAHEFGSGIEDVANIFGPAPNGRRARIIAPIATQNTTEIAKLLMNGVDVAKLSVEDSTPAQLREQIGRIRQAAMSLGRPVSVMLDLGGHPQQERILGELLSDVDMVAVAAGEKTTCRQNNLMARQLMVQRGRIIPIVATIDSAAEVVGLHNIASIADGLVADRTALVSDLGRQMHSFLREMHSMGDALGCATIMTVPKRTVPVDGMDDGLYDAIIDRGADAVMCPPELANEKGIDWVAGGIETAEQDKRDALYKEMAASTPEMLTARRR